MDILIGLNCVCLEGLTYEEAEVICLALDDFRCNYNRSSKSSERMDSECADSLYRELDEALHPLDEGVW